VQLGDLLNWRDARWLAVAIDRTRRLMSLRNVEGTIVGVPLNLERSRSRECKVIANPSQYWPCIIRKPIAASAGKLEGITRNAAPYALHPLYDWVLDDMDRRGGGTIFFNPTLNLVTGETLVATFKSGRSTRIVIPANFATTAERIAKLAEANREPRTVYDRLLSDDGPFEDEDDFILLCPENRKMHDFGPWLKEAEALHRERLVSDSLRESWRTKVDVTRARLAQAQAELELEVVRAPIDGQVLEVFARAGERVGPQGILELGRTHQMYAVAEVYETDIGRVRLGQRATVRSPALAAALGGSVDKIHPKIGKQDVLDTDPARSRSRCAASRGRWRSARCAPSIRRRSSEWSRDPPSPSTASATSSGSRRSAARSSSR